MRIAKTSIIIFYRASRVISIKNKSPRILRIFSQNTELIAFKNGLKNWNLLLTQIYISDNHEMWYTAIMFHANLMA